MFSKQRVSLNFVEFRASKISWVLIACMRWFDFAFQNCLTLVSGSKRVLTSFDIFDYISINF